MVAHGNYLEDLVIALMTLPLFGVGVLRISAGEITADGRCPYCGDPGAREAERCGSCGFRVGTRLADR